MAKQEKTDVDKNATNLTKDYYNEKSQKSIENRQKGGSDVEIDLLNTTKVRFTKNFGFNKKGTELTISDVAFEIYSKKGVVEKLN